MERDQLEKFFLEHREAFEDGLPSLKVWGDIDRRLSAQKPQPMKLRVALRLAAAIAALLVIGGVAGSYLTKRNSQDTMAILESVAPEYLEIEAYYEEQINAKVKQLTQYDPNTPVLNDLQQMDRAMAELKQELMSAPKGKEEEIVATMIQTYQTKVAILERVLAYMQQAKPQNSKPLRNETSM